ncbi:YceI family protein [Carboxylicivirga taeanensis]|uniref:YceI family protein n=1 Tax=Carboxylicivirga taeanensis TaxID=1416875 RepID=UPI003F6DBA90
MKRIPILLVALILFVSFAEAQKRQVDVKLSEVTWTGKKVTGEHTGKIMFKEGFVQLKDKQLVGGEFVIDMNTITCTDLDNPDYNAKLVGHLKSDDFFGVENYPHSKLVLNNVSAIGKGYKVSGDLTIKGKTHPVSFEVKHSDHVFEGKMVIDRTKYDVRYGSGKFFDNLGDKMIYDNFELVFKVVLLK